MQKFDNGELVVSGVGITSAIGIGKDAFSASLLAGKHNFREMRREGRQLPILNEENTPAFLGAEIEGFLMPEEFTRFQRGVSLSAQIALGTVREAWHDANLSDHDPDRIGLIVGGNNFQQRELTITHDNFRKDPSYLRPSYAVSFMDTDLCGVVSEAFNIRGMAYTLGGASASGQLAVFQAIQMVQSGEVDVCIALGAMMDLSYWELQAFRSLGAMGSDRFSTQPDLACRPFDTQRDGFIFGESCAALVIENREKIQRKAVNPYAKLLGWSMYMDANRNPNPSVEGESTVIKRALAKANLSSANIDYVNPHGTGSPVGDETELAALSACQLQHAYINTTKSITGHALTAAGATELAATILQMRAQQLHPSRNLVEPINNQFNWVEQPTHQRITNALKLSMGFGGINTAMCLQNI